MPGEDVLLSIETDPCTEQYALRIPAVTKAHIDRLDAKTKKEMNEAIMLAIDSVLYKRDYKPGRYLKTE